MARKVFQIILWIGTGAYVIAGVLTVVCARDGYREAESLGSAYVVFGCLFLLVVALVALTTFLAGKSGVWFIVAPLILGSGLFLGLFAMFWIDMERGEVHRRALQAEVRSGRYDFGDQPALLAVAQAITANDQAAIRTAAKNVPDLQAPGRDGSTLLAWAVRETWQRSELVEAVRTLLSLGADPNYTNGHRESFVLANAVHGPAAGLRAILDAGGDPNAFQARLLQERGTCPARHAPGPRRRHQRGRARNGIGVRRLHAIALYGPKWIARQQRVRERVPSPGAWRGLISRRSWGDDIIQNAEGAPKTAWKKPAASFYAALGLGTSAWDCGAV